MLHQPLDRKRVTWMANLKFYWLLILLASCSFPGLAQSLFQSPQGCRLCAHKQFSYVLFYCFLGFWLWAKKPFAGVGSVPMSVPSMARLTPRQCVLPLMSSFCVICDQKHNSTPVSTCFTGVPYKNTSFGGYIQPFSLRLRCEHLGLSWRTKSGAVLIFSISLFYPPTHRLVSPLAHANHLMQIDICK